MNLLRASKVASYRTVNNRGFLGAFCCVVTILFAFLVIRGHVNYLTEVYKNRFPVATPSELCPGDQFTYSVQVSVKNDDSVIRVTEGWCNETDGLNYCPWELQLDPKWVNVVDSEKLIRSPVANRVVPEELTPGTWALRHCNSAFVTGQEAIVSCYSVAITVLPPDQCQ